MGYGFALQVNCLEGFDSLGFHQRKNMKRLITMLLTLVFIAVIALALQYIGSPENSISLKNDWGIVSDSPIKKKF